MPEECGQLDEDLDIQKSLERMESSLVGLRKSALELAQYLERLDGQRKGRVREALRKLALSATELHEAVLAFKWEMLEYDADRGERVQRSDSAPDDIKRLLERA